MKKITKNSIPKLVKNSSGSDLRTNLNNLILDFVTRNRTVLIILSLALILGTFIGGIVYSRLIQQAKNEIFTYMQNYFIGSDILSVPKFEVFKSKLTYHLASAVLIAAAGFSIFVFPLIVIREAAKGFGIGFSVTFLVARYGFKGVLFSVVSPVLSNAVIILSEFWFASACADISISRRIQLGKGAGHRKPARICLDKLVSVIPRFIIFILLALISSFLEAFVFKALLDGIYSIVTYLS